MDEAMESMTRAVEVSSSDLAATPIHRRHCVSALKFHVQPIPIYFDFFCAFGELLRGGYVGRNFLDPAALNAYYAEEDRTAGSAQTNEDRFGRPDADGTALGVDDDKSFWRKRQTTSGALGLIGTSGMGKTTMALAVAECYEQVWIHREYKGRKVNFTQVVWLYMQCPHDGSAVAFCDSFFEALDEVLGTTYADDYAEGTANKKLRQIRRLVKTYHLGALIIDELQNLSHAKVGGRKQMLAFFNQLVSSVGVPIVYAGTYAATALFEEALSTARRATGDGGTFNFPCAKPQDSWWGLIKASLWDRQWTDEVAELTAPISALLDALTQGVTAILYLLLCLSQKEALKLGMRAIDAALLSSVHSKYLGLLKPALTALQSGKPNALQLFEDLMPRMEVITKHIEQLESSEADPNNVATMKWLQRNRSPARPEGQRGRTKKPAPALQLAPFDFDAQAIKAIAGNVSVLTSLASADRFDSLSKAGLLDLDPFELRDATVN
jgi:hypothetical protein